MRALLWVTELFSSSGGAGRCCPPCPGAVGCVAGGCCSNAPRPRLPRWGGSVCACARHKANSMVVATANKLFIFVSPFRTITSRRPDRETSATHSLTRLFFELWRDVRNFNRNQLLGG